MDFYLFWWEIAYRHRSFPVQLSVRTGSSLWSTVPKAALSSSRTSTVVLLESVLMRMKTCVWWSWKPDWKTTKRLVIVRKQFNCWNGLFTWWSGFNFYSKGLRSATVYPKLFEYPELANSLKLIQFFEVGSASLLLTSGGRVWGWELLITVVNTFPSCVWSLDLFQLDLCSCSFLLGLESMQQ